MGAPLRKKTTSIKTQIFKAPYEFEFAKAVSLLEQLYPDKQTVGDAANIAGEVVKLRSLISLSTPPSDIYSLEKLKSKQSQAVLTVNFFGIAGQAGPLPNVYNELILDRLSSKDPSFKEFLDIFNHRLLSVHYKNQVKYNLSLDKAKTENTRAANVLKHIGGLTYAEVSKQHKVNLRSYLRYVGLLWQKPHSMIGLETILNDYFGLPTKVKQFMGHWYPLECEQTTIIGEHHQNARLGEEAVLGTKVWLQSEKIRIKIGPVPLEHYHSLLPGGAANYAVAEVARHYLGRDFVFNFELHLKDSEAEPARLKGESALGWNSWLESSATSHLDSVIVKAEDPLRRS